MKKIWWSYFIGSGLICALFNAHNTMNHRRDRYIDLVDRLIRGSGAATVGLLFGFIELPLLFILRDENGNFEYLPIKFK